MLILSAEFSLWQRKTLNSEAAQHVPLTCSTGTLQFNCEPNEKPKHASLNEHGQILAHEFVEVFDIAREKHFSPFAFLAFLCIGESTIRQCGFCSSQIDIELSMFVAM